MVQGTFVNSLSYSSCQSMIENSNLVDGPYMSSKSIFSHTIWKNQVFPEKIWIMYWALSNGTPILEIPKESNFIPKQPSILTTSRVNYIPTSPTTDMLWITFLALENIWLEKYFFQGRNWFYQQEPISLYGGNIIGQNEDRSLVVYWSRRYFTSKIQH